MEQILYISRIDNSEKDFFIRELCLEEIVHSSIMYFREVFLREKIRLNIHDLNEYVYTDEKWIVFIINQIIQNSIKYYDKKEKNLEIYSCKTNDNETEKRVLIIRDNGIGIKSYDLPRVFEQGFTGSDRQKIHSTGMGLYISKKLCDKLGLDIEIVSEENKYTEVKIIF